MHPIPVFVINLKRDKERLDFMQRQLDKINIPFETVPAVDGNSILGGSLSRKQIGCWMSHIKAWRIMLERDLPAALILEDDVLLAEDFPEVFRNLRLPDECQILQLVALHELHSVRHRVFSPYGAVSLPRGWKMACRPLGESYGTQAYIIRPALARRLLQEESRLRLPIDYVLFFWRLTFYPPWIVYKKDQRGMYVTLGEEKRDWGGAIFENELKRGFIARRIKEELDASRMLAAADSAGDKNLPVFLINLKKDVRRLETMQRRFDAMDLSFETVEAVDGKLIPAETMHKIYSRRRTRWNIRRELSPAEIGRYLSHLKAHRALLNTDAPAAVIVEDNAALDDDFPKCIRYSADPNKPSGDRAKRGVFRWKPVFSPPPFPVSLPHGHRPPDDEEIKKFKAGEVVRRFRSQAYIIQRSRAQYLLRKEGRIQRPIEDLLFLRRKNLKKLFLRRFHIIFWDALALFSTHVLCRIFPPPRANKFSQLELDALPRASAWQDFKVILSCYSFSRPFGLHLGKRKTDKPAQE